MLKTLPCLVGTPCPLTDSNAREQICAASRLPSMEYRNFPRKPCSCGNLSSPTNCTWTSLSVRAWNKTRPKSLTMNTSPLLAVAVMDDTAFKTSNGGCRGKIIFPPVGVDLPGRESRSIIKLVLVAFVDARSILHWLVDGRFVSNTHRRAPSRMIPSS